MAQSPTQLASGKFTSFADILLDEPFLGVYLDLKTKDIPSGGWSIHDGWHLFNGRLMCYPGWRKWKPDGATAIQLGSAPSYAFDFIKVNQDRYLIFGDKDYLYLFNRVINPLTADAANTLTILNAVPFGGTIYERWQSAVINDQLILVNINTAAPQVFVDNATALADLAGDATMPTGAKFVLNSVNHLIFCDTVEGGNKYHQRVRWSDINAPTVFTPALGTNEANYFDIFDDSGEIRGAASIGPNQFVVYTTKDAYLFTYVGLPAVWNIQNKALTDIGCTGTYSLATKENNQFFFGTDGFYQVSATLVPARIGENKIDSTVFNRFQLNYPWNMYSFVHPIYPEVWFIEQNRGDTFFKRVYAYNWERGMWATREYFPFSAVCEALLSNSRTMNNINTTASTTLTWAQKPGSGSLVLLSGDADGYIHIHDGLDRDADGLPLKRQLRSGDLTLGDWARPTRLSQIFYSLTDIDLSLEQLTSTILSRKNTQEGFSLDDQFVLDRDSRHDIRLINKLFQIDLSTFATPSLSSIIFTAQPAGLRS